MNPVSISSSSPSPSADEVVEQMLRDQDFLLAKEIKHKVAELNQLLVRAQSRKLKVEIDATQVNVASGGTVSYVDLKVYKQL